MNGKEKCNLLREMRKEIARVNGIVYLTGECKQSNYCIGTCSTCDAETRYLENELTNKVLSGNTIKLSGISFDSFIFASEMKYLFNDSKDAIKYLEDEPLEEEKTQLTIDELNITARPYNALKRAGIFTVDELTDMTVKDMKRIRNMGDKSLNEIKLALEDLGLSFKTND